MVNDTVLTNGMTQKVEAWGMASGSGQYNAMFYKPVTTIIAVIKDDLHMQTANL